MRPAFPTIRPLGQYTRYFASSNVRIINKSGRRIPAQLISKAIEFARELHASKKNLFAPGTPMDEYTSRQCFTGVAPVWNYIREELGANTKPEYLEGIFVENERDEQIMFNHLLPLLDFGDFFMMVDFTAAQLGRVKPNLKKTEVLIVITIPNIIAARLILQEIYGGTYWQYGVTGSAGIHLTSCFPTDESWWNKPGF